MAPLSYRLTVHVRKFQSWSTSRKEVKLRFRCTECGKCCTGRGGRVRVNDREIKELAAFKNLTVNDFKRKHTLELNKNNNGQNVTQSILLQTSDDNQCIFLQGSKCSVYKVRPTQCRTFPWWPEHLVSEYDWQLAANQCEGIHVNQEDVQDNIPVYTFDDVILQTIMHDIHRSGENYTYDELQQLLRDLREVEPQFINEYKAELLNKFSRQIVYHDNEVTVLDTFFEEEIKPTRKFVYNNRPHLIQSEVALSKMPSHSEEKFDRSSLALDVHRALCLSFAWLPNEKIQSSIRVIVFGGGACTLPLFLLEHHSSKEIMQLVTVEPCRTVNEIARRFFGVDSALKSDSRLSIQETTGEDFVLNYTKAAPFDIAVFDVEAGKSCDGVWAPSIGMLDVSFLERMKCLLISGGVMAINVITETEEALSNVEAKIGLVFSRGLRLSLPTNTVLFFFNEDSNVNTVLNVVEYIRSVQRSEFQTRYALTPSLLKKYQLTAIESKTLTK
ncbi:Predicted spermine/spermidine synthase [Plasmopara halstedii]|uniref:Predicted spermine/spermidine synthase n=1 Tax=Plasmopara halstedii TaxID=4781 RepID=A0A0P1ASS1_PLAHL|nr:Predicted spermine/spermidine synthase [Plasmopara halstedii]CEG43880.1 Predicted spermine/spermidine synthase [Plasmopara halstedii]|eukprot:XP_024580249.1 Predicted spermine/spermidine synthase [Plasmopara halstedii]